MPRHEMRYAPIEVTGSTPSTHAALQFEIASEETEKMTVYAEDDRQAAREELTKLEEAYSTVVGGPDKELAEEVKRRVGQRIRELQSAVNAMEEQAMNQD